MNKVVKRESNFELLRIVSMFFIVLHHLLYHGGYRVGSVFNFNNFILTFFMSGGKLGVVLFAMITGYYMIKSKDIKVSKLIGLELQVLFYSLGIYIIFMVFGNRQFVLDEFFKILFPNINKSYWFFSSYFILYLFIPFLNRMVNNINKREFEKLLIIGFIFLILVPSIIIYSKPITEGIYLFYYYLVGAYIRMYSDDVKGGIKYLLGFVSAYLMIILITIFIGNLSSSNIILLEFVNAFSKLGSILVFVSAVSLFMFFKCLKIKSNKIINVVASTTFGVYLFHEHIFMKELLWDNIFSLDKLVNSSSVFITGINISVVVYVVGVLIDLLRQVIFKYFYNMIEKVSAKAK